MVKDLQETAGRIGIDVVYQRKVFEQMHTGRNLSQLRQSRGYSSPPIAALWAQHLRTLIFIKSDGQYWQ